MKAKPFVAWLAAVVCLAGALCAAKSAQPGSGDSRDAFFQIPAKFTNSLTLAPGADDGRIARTVARVFEHSHYSRHPFDRSIGEKMFDEFVTTLDPQRNYFLQSDIDEWAEMRTNISEITLRQNSVEPGFTIFNRFLTRYDEAYSQAIEQLRRGDFHFDSDESFLVNRKNAPRPRDLSEARRLWTDRLRFEYLAEKLNSPSFQPTLETIRKRVASPGASASLVSALTNKFSAAEAGSLATVATDAYGQAVEAKRGEKAAVDAAVDAAQKRLELLQREDITKKLVRRYQRVLRTFKQFEPDEVTGLWLDSLGHAYDPHTDYLGPREIEQFAMQMNLRLFGIGATLSSEDGFTVIKEVRPGTPAERSRQLKVNDKIVGVAQGDGEFADVVDEKLSKVVEQIRGNKGTKVRLAVIPAGADASARKVISIIRDEIKLEDAEARAKIVEMAANGGQTRRVGVIDLPSFYANFSVGSVSGSGKTTTGDVLKLLKKLKSENVTGVILDLRRNGGGSLEEAINLTGLFIRSGPVVQVRNFDDAVQVDEDTDETIAYDGPLIVLTSRFSASASEILAAALQDYGRALVVGDSSTHGKGTVQTVQELRQFLRGVEKPGAVKTTIRKFYRPSGGSTQIRGVVPDIVLPSVNNYAEVGEQSLDNALQWDTVPSAKFERVDRVDPYLAELTKRSNERIAKDRDFAYIAEDIARYRESLAKKYVSLSESVRRKEIEREKARIEARKKEIASREDAPPVTYDITLKVADLPGLPPPETNSVPAVNFAKSGATKGGANKGAVAVQPGVSPAADTVAQTSAPAAESTLDGEDGEDPDAATTPHPLDVHLRETERILIDYVELMRRKSGVAARTR